jgi:uridine phosphorylase
MIEEVIINPGKERGEPELPATGILCINPGDAKLLAERAVKMSGKRHFLFNSKLHIVSGPERGRSFFVAGPTIGAPMAVIALEKLIALGANRVIVCGWCGSLNPQLKTGDILLPTWGLSEEGTSAHYPISSKATSSESLRAELSTIIRNSQFNCTEGPIWTTDALFRETKGKVRDYAQESILAVDMEFSALATVAIYRGIDLAAALIVSDQLWGEKWQPGFRNQQFRENSKKILKLLFNFTAGMA